MAKGARGFSLIEVLVALLLISGTGIFILQIQWRIKQELNHSIFRVLTNQQSINETQLLNSN